MRRLGSTTTSINMNLLKLWETAEDREVWSVAVHGITKESELLSNNNKMNSTNFNF